MASMKSQPSSRAEPFVNSTLSQTQRMRPIVLATLILTLAPTSFLSAQQINDRAVLTRRKVILTRPPAVVRHFPQRKRALVSYPVISGLSDPRVLRKVKNLVSVKNVFGYSLNEYRTDTWLEEFDYEVNHNGNFILDLTFTQVGSAAYPDSQWKHFAINLKSGNQLKATDVFVAEKQAELAALVDRKLKDEVSDLLLQAKRDLEQQDFQNVADALELQKFETQQLDDFSVGPNGITFLYDAGFPHVIEALEPEGRYFFSYSELKPFIKRSGLLGQFVR